MRFTYGKLLARFFALRMRLSLPFDRAAQRARVRFDENQDKLEAERIRFRLQRQLDLERQIAAESAGGQSNLAVATEEREALVRGDRVVIKPESVREETFAPALPSGDVETVDVPDFERLLEEYHTTSDFDMSGVRLGDATENRRREMRVGDDDSTEIEIVEGIEVSDGGIDPESSADFMYFASGHLFPKS